MANPKRARSGKPRKQPRGCTYTHSTDLPSALERIRLAARRDKKVRFTALLHHVDVAWLRWSFSKLKHEARPGVDGVTWQQYEEGLEDRLTDLHERLHRGAYRAQPSKRVWIPKPDGRQRRASRRGSTRPGRWPEE